MSIQAWLDLNGIFCDIIMKYIWGQKCACEVKAIEKRCKKFILKLEENYGYKAY